MNTPPAPANREERLIFAPGEPSQSSQSEPSQPSRAAQFTSPPLPLSSLSPTPIPQFHTWFSSLPAIPPSSAPHLPVPETCTLSTSSLPSGRVSSRTVYLKELTPRAFIIYSNFSTSGKAADLASNPNAALCFWWKSVERQVRVEGKAERLSRAESGVYWETRARGSKVGAWASRQSQVLYLKGSDGDGKGGEGDDERDGREVLEARVREVEEKFEGVEDVPLPEGWGGLRIVPDRVEFWQGRESRLHDRFVYTRIEDGEEEGEGQWKIERLSP